MILSLTGLQSFARLMGVKSSPRLLVIGSFGVFLLIVCIELPLLTLLMYWPGLIELILGNPGVCGPHGYNLRHTECGHNTARPWPCKYH